MPFDQFKRWNRLVSEEFLLQGDLEKVEFGQLISPAAGFDRAVAKGKAEHGFTRFFMRYLSLPLFEKLHTLSRVGAPAAQQQIGRDNIVISDGGISQVSKEAALLTATTLESSSIGSKDSHVECWTCGQNGHKSKHCPSAKQHPSKQPKTNVIAGVDMSVMLTNLYANIKRWDDIQFEEEEEDGDDDDNDEKRKSKNDIVERESDGSFDEEDADVKEYCDDDQDIISNPKDSICNKNGIAAKVESSRKEASIPILRAALARKDTGNTVPTVAELQSHRGSLSDDDDDDEEEEEEEDEDQD